MDTPSVSTRAPEASPTPPRRRWITPAIEELGEMKDLTLQSSIGGECPIENPVCFP